jgi:hypothetical protein
MSRKRTLTGLQVHAHEEVIHTGKLISQTVIAWRLRQLAE